MNILTSVVARLDAFQQRHAILGFPYAVIKKYGEDNGGYLAALLTYYGFLSLFPLLLVTVTVLQLLFDAQSSIVEGISQGIDTYFPLLGNELQSNIETNGKTGIGLIVGTLFALYGARGSADTLRFAVDTVWLVPKLKRVGWPKSILKSLSVMGIGAIGFLATVAASVATSALGQAWWVEVLLNFLGFVIVTTALILAVRAAASRKVSIGKLVWGGAVAGLGIQLLLTFGGLLLARQLKSFDSVYGTFAIVLGLLFWMYLLAQVVLYAIEIDTVRTLKLWPRGLDAKHPTAADKKAYRRYAKLEKYVPPQTIAVDFSSEKSIVTPGEKSDRSAKKHPEN